jgi:hypothetical protein
LQQTKCADHTILPAFAVILVLHGLIHLLGAAKAFGWAEIPVKRPRSRRELVPRHAE